MAIGGRDGAGGEIRERFPGKTIWLYTGYTYEEIKDLEVMEYVDVLVDGEFVAKQKDSQLCWRGSGNQRVIDVPATRRSRHGGAALRVTC